MAMTSNGLPDEFEDMSHMNSTELARLVHSLDDTTANQLLQQTINMHQPAHQQQPMADCRMGHHFGPGAQESNAQQGRSMLYAQGVTSPYNAPPPSRDEAPRVEIIEQPKSRGLRFRYECEGRSAGSVPGENSSTDHRTYPTIRIHNYSGPAIIVVSCVTKEAPPHCKPHPHSIVGRDCKKGVCTLRVKDTSDKIVFPNIGIQCAKKKDVEGALKLRKEINVDPYQTGFDHAQSNIDLNVVRLCFQVFLPNEQGKVTRVVPPVCSHAIHDKKSSKDLVICRVDKSSGKARGGDEVFLLCDKVNKEDIKVRFYEENEQGVTSWEDYGDFGQGDVHRQFAIVFRTPSYHGQYITKPVEVFMQLQRPSDGETSEPIPFTFMPEDPDPDRIAEKRKRKVQRLYEYWTTTNGGDRRGSGSPSVRGRLHSMLKATRRIKKEPNASQGLPEFSNPDGSGEVVGAVAGAQDGAVSHITVDNSSMGSVTVSSLSAGSLDSSVIAGLSGLSSSGLSSSDLSVVSLDNGQLVVSVSGGEGSGLSVDSINLPNNLLSGELMNQIDIQQLNAYLQDQNSGCEILLDQQAQGGDPNMMGLQGHATMDTDPETEAALQGLNDQILISVNLPHPYEMSSLLSALDAGQWRFAKKSKQEVGIKQ